MKEKEVLVKVEGVSKKFCKDLKTSLWYGIRDLFSNVQGNKNERSLRDKEFWALRNINFELRRGECLGLIGHNGAGKSTLLKILNGLIKPDAGKVMIKGKVGALIELGAGFNPILTGRENIYNNGAVLGLSRNEINNKLEAIIDFAEVREFIDMPVQHYSSGMKVRLGFAIAAQMSPDVLIIDEVLAVGDLGFMLKCFRTIDEILPDTAIIFVSHSMPQISRLCTQIILMDHGTPEFSGNNVSKAIDLYYSRFASNQSNLIYCDESIYLKDAEILNFKNEIKGIPLLNWKDDLKINFSFSCPGLKVVPKFIITIYDKEQRPVAVLKTNNKNSNIEIKQGCIDFIVTHRNLQLSKGVYTINVSVYSMISPKPLMRINGILSFQMKYKEMVWEPFMLDSTFESVPN